MVMAKTNPVPTVNLPPKPIPAPLPPQEKTIGPGGCVPAPDFPKPDGFELKDKNGDDKLNADEFNAGRGLIEKIADPDKFDRYDTNNDGYVTKFENSAGEFRDAVGDLRKSQHTLPGGKKYEPGELEGNGGIFEAPEGQGGNQGPDFELPELPAFKRGAARVE